MTEVEPSSAMFCIRYILQHWELSSNILHFESTIDLIPQRKMPIDGYNTIFEYKVIMNLNMIHNNVFKQDLV
jgi:hypothetical protein